MQKPADKADMYLCYFFGPARIGTGTMSSELCASRTALQQCAIRPVLNMQQNGKTLYQDIDITLPAESSY